MAFMLGPFAEGLSKGANSAMDLYNKYEDFSTTQDLRQEMKKQHDAKGLGTAAPPQAGADITREAGTNTLGGAQSDSAASAPAQPYKPIDISDMPDPRLRAAGAALRFTPEVLSGNHTAPPATAALPPAGSAATPLVQNPQFQPGATTSPTNMTTYDVPNGGPNSSAPIGYNNPAPPTQRWNAGDMSRLTNRPVGSAIGDVMHGRPAPSYLPPTSPQPQVRPQQAMPVGRPAISGQPAATAPTLAGPPSLGQRILGSFGDMANQGVPY